VLGYAAPASSFTTDLRARWVVDEDLLRWSARFGESYVVGPGAPPLFGVFWTQTPGRVGLDFPDAVRSLSSHYRSGGVERLLLEPRAPWPCLRMVGPLVGPTPCLLCGASPTAPWLARPGLSLPSCEPMPFERPVLLTPWGTLSSAPVFAGDPWELLVEGVTGQWVAASEPDAWLPATGLRYAALSLETMKLERVLLGTPAGLSPVVVQPGPCPFCDPLPQPLSARGGPLAPAQAIAVLSARRELLWLLGEGTGPTGASVLDLSAERWRAMELPEGLGLGRVLGAVYDAAGDSLLVLDEVRGPRGRGRGVGARRVRLLRLEPLGGAGEVLFSAPRTGAASRFALAVDPSGALYVASSGDSAGPHVVLRLEGLGSEVRVTGFAVGRGVLETSQARASELGLSLVVRERGEQRVVGYRTGELLPASEAAVRRCF